MKKLQDIVKYSMLRRMLAFFLTTVMLTVAIPPFSISFGDEEKSLVANEIQTPEENREESPADGYTYTEVVELREEYSKHFRRSDGQMVAVVYPEAVHRNENGVMVDIDNSLDYLSSEKKYRTANETFNVSFSETPSADHSVSVTSEGYTLSWRLDVVRSGEVLNPWQTSSLSLQNAISGVTAERASSSSVASLTGRALVDANRGAPYTKEEIHSTFSSVSSVSYADAFTGSGRVDLRYTVSENRVEEDIILKEKGNIRSYVMQIKADGLTATLLEDGSVAFLDHEGTVVYTVGAPWMCDATGEVSDEIAVAVSQKGSAVTVVYTPDEAWLNDGARVYPVLIDPSIRAKSYTGNYLDTYVYTGSTVTSAINSRTFMLVGHSGSTAYEGYVKILNYPCVTDAMDISSVTLTFNANKSNADQRMKFLLGSSSDFCEEDSNGVWSIQSDLSFDNRPLGSGVTFVPTVTQAATNSYYYTYDITQQVKNYASIYGSLNEVFDNYIRGFRLFDTNADGTNANHMFISSEFATVERRPTLEITYVYGQDIPVVNGGVYSIQNLYSGKRLTVAETATNAHQAPSLALSLQAFTMVGDGIFTIQPVSRSGEALTFAYAGSSAAQAATNVYSATLSSAAADSQEFLVQYVRTDDSGYHWYAILSRADTNMALTVSGTGTGSTTGTAVTDTGNVYMDVYTGEDRQLWSFYSGGKPCFVGENIVESNGASLVYPYGIGDAMIQPFCYVTAVGDTVTWSSSNSSAVSFSSDGKATIQGVGMTTLTATVKDSSGAVKNTYSYDVILYIEEGVYYIQNTNTNEYLGLPDDVIKSGTHAQMQSKITSGDAMYGQLWKIYHVGNGLYRIRSMRNLTLGLGTEGSVVELHSLGISDTLEGNTDAIWDFMMTQWDGYLIRLNRADSDALFATPFDIGICDFENTDDDIDEENHIWELEKVTISDGTLIVQGTAQPWIAPEESFDLDVVYYSHEMKSQSVTWTSSNSSVATVTDTGAVVGVSQGAATITGISEADTNKRISFTVNVSAVAEGVYLIENVDTEKLIQPDEDGENHIEQFDFEGQWSQFWFFERYMDSYYLIRNKKTGLYLTSPTSTEENRAILQSDFSEDNILRQLWAISIAENGSYVLQSKAMELYSMYLAVGWGAGWNGNNVEQRVYSSAYSQRLRWFLKDTSVILNTPLIKQYESMWCWAASAQMMVRTNYSFEQNEELDSIIENEQRAMVYHVYGDNSSNAEEYDWINDPQNLKSKGGSYLDVGKAAAFLANRLGEDVTYSAYATPYTEEILVGLLSDGYAICRLYGWLTVNYPETICISNLPQVLSGLDPNIGGHVTVVVGCKWDHDDNKYTFLVYDPWCDEEVHEAEKHYVYCTYEELAFDSIRNGDMVETRLWFPTVVPKTDYTSKTLLEEIIGVDYSS